MTASGSLLLRRIDDAIETAAIAVSVAWERRLFDGWREAAAVALREEAEAPAVAAPRLQERACLPFLGGAAGLFLCNGGFPATGAIYCVVMSMISVGFLFRAFAAAGSPSANAEMRTAARDGRQAVAVPSRVVAAAWIAFPIVGFGAAFLNLVTALKGIR